MLKKIMIVIALMLLISNASGWEIKGAKYDVANKTLSINFSLSPLENFLLFVLGGDYTKSITKNLIRGDYELLSAGYNCVCIRVNGQIQFKKPIEILIKNGYVRYMVNTTYFDPEFFIA